MNAPGSPVAAATLLLLAAPSAAQTFVARADADGAFPSGAASADGRTAVAWNDASHVLATVFGPDGHLEHSLELQPSSGPSLRAFGLAFTPAGDLLFAGDADEEPWVGCYRPSTGAVVWDYTASTSFGQLASVTTLKDGNVLACGSVENAAAAPETLVVLLDPSGALVWQRLYSDLAGNNWGYDVAPAADGGAWLAGYSTGGLRVTRIQPGPSSWTAWQKEYAIADKLAYTRIRETDDGGLVVAGVTEPIDDVLRAGAMKLSAGGAVEWARGYASSDQSYWDAGLMRVGGVAELPGGGYAITASQPVAGAPADRDLAVLRVDAQGLVVSYRNVGVPGIGDEALALGRLADGTLLSASWVDLHGPRALRLASGGGSGLDCAPETALPASAYALAVGVKATIWGFQPEWPSAPQVHASAAPLAVVGWIECSNPCEVKTLPFGVGLAGSGGAVPQIYGTDGPCTGGAVLHVANGLGGTAGVLGFSFGTGALQAFGGWVWLDPAGAFLLPIGLSGSAGVPGAGGLTLPLTVDLTPLVGVQIHAQAFLVDPGAPQGVAMTGALTLDVD